MTKVTHDCADELKEVNLNATEARIATMQLFESHEEPIDAQHLLEDLQKKFKIDRVTVFRILNTFTEKGLLKKLEFGEGKARYELAQEEDHHHLICENCGAIEDIPDTLIPGVEKEIQQKHKFLVKKHSLEFFGLCANCNK